MLGWSHQREGHFWCTLDLELLHALLCTPGSRCCGVAAEMPSQFYLYSKHLHQMQTMHVETVQWQEF